MSVSLEQFYTRVLRELRVVPPNGTAQAEDRQRVVDIYPNIHAMLLERKLVRWGVSEALPDSFAIPVIKITAYALTADFSVPDTRYMILKQEGELDSVPHSWAERTLRKMQDEEYVASPIANDFF
jgi:hypothetical protein